MGRCKCRLAYVSDGNFYPSWSKNEVILEKLTKFVFSHEAYVKTWWCEEFFSTPSAGLTWGVTKNCKTCLMKNFMRNSLLFESFFHKLIIFRYFCKKPILGAFISQKNLARGWRWQFLTRWLENDLQQSSSLNLLFAKTFIFSKWL